MTTEGKNQVINYEAKAIRKETPQWLVRFLIWFCGILMGAGGMGLTVVAQVHTNTIEIGHLKETDRQIIDQARVDRESFDKRMSLVVDLVGKQLESERELITLIKVQRQIQQPQKP